MVDWEEILTRNHIDYKPGSGANIETHCSWCGYADEGMHLSISLEGLGYHCWRRPLEHSGKNEARLLARLLNISVQDARLHLGYANERVMVGSNFADSVRTIMGGGGSHSNSRHSSVVPIKTLAYPKEFRAITADSTAIKPVFRYLVEDRRYSEREAEEACRAYDLKTAITGQFRYRVIFPCYMPNMGLVNWTARSITYSTYLRYITLTTPPATMPISHVLWNYEDITNTGGKTLIICEGPFDALRVDYFGFMHGIRATCTFGKNISNQQIDLMTKVRDKFDNVVLVLDQDAQMELLSTLGRFSHLQPRTARLPANIKDPAEFSHEGFKEWISCLPR